MTQPNDVSRTALHIRTVSCMCVTVLCLLFLWVATPCAYAANGDGPESVTLQVAGNDAEQINVVKDVASLDKQKKDTKVTLTVKDAYTGKDASERNRELVLMDSSGKTTKQLTSSRNDTLQFSIGDLVDGQRVALITSAKDGNGPVGKRYQKTLNIRLIDTTKAEAPFGAEPNSSAKKESDGSWQWSFSNGLEYTFKNTGFSFLDNTKMNLGALKLPLKFKHNADGTTIVGINCNPEDKAFWSAVKNKNVWQKYSTEKMAEMTKKMDKGFSGKGLGKWGGKGFDWNILGYMEFNTEKPEAPRALNLVLSAGVKAEGHAQYLIFTGTITFTLGGKATISGKLVPAKGVEGNFGLGIYGGLELYVGLGLNYVASVGGYGSGRIDVDFQVLPSFYLDKVKVAGQLGAKAKVFGFTVYTWTILNKEAVLYDHAKDAKSSTASAASSTMPALSALLSSALGTGEASGGSEVVGPPTAQEASQNPQADGDGTATDGATSGDPSKTSGATGSSDETTNPDGTATSPFGVSADEPYPLDSREYLEEETEATDEQDALHAQEDGGVAAEQANANAVTTQATKADTTILKGIYGEAEPVCATTNDGPVIVYVADAAQVAGAGTRDDANRSVLAYTRLKNGVWTNPKVIDASSEYKNYADYSPSVTTDGNNCYVAWLAADSKVNAINGKGEIGEVGKKLDVNMATIAKDDTITVQTVHKESDNNGTMPAGAKAVKVGNGLYVGFYTNQTSGNSSEVLGLNGTHNVRLFKQGASNAWTEVATTTTENGAITSFDVGGYGNTAACAWSLDTDLSEEKETISLNGVESLSSSAVWTLPAGGKAEIVSHSNSTNAQFAKRDGADVLTYAQQIMVNDGSESLPYLNIQSSSSPGHAGEIVLDGTKVNLPTSHYKITGDISQNKAGNVSFLVAGNGSSDIKALITTGNGEDSWTNVMDATVTDKIITNYCATYVDGLPKFIYLEEGSASDGFAAEAASDGSADLNQSTEDSLRHLSVNDLDYDEYEVRSGAQMPVAVHFENDGMLDVHSVDVWLMEDGVLTQVASEDMSVPLDEEASLTFDYTVPSADEFVGAREFTVYVSPKGATVNAAIIERAKVDGSAMTASLGGPSLALDANHQIVDDKESVTATITNDGIASHGAKLVFLNAESDETLATVDVPELSEGTSFSYTYSAPKDFFQNDGIDAMIVTLEDDGSENEGYELNNTEFVNTWDVKTYGTETPSINRSTGTTRAALPNTADPMSLMAIPMMLVGAHCAFACARRIRR